MGIHFSHAQAFPEVEMIGTFTAALAKLTFGAANGLQLAPPTGTKGADRRPEGDSSPFLLTTRTTRVVFHESDKLIIVAKTLHRW